MQRKLTGMKEMNRDIKTNLKNFFIPAYPLYPC
jgi:hypothetical protein